MESIGVMPEPAATRTWCPGSPRAGVNRPVGSITSTTSPGRTSRTSQVEKRPSGTTRTPMRGAAPTGAQSEYERRSSRPSTVRRTVRDWPGAKAKASARASGTSKVTAAASSHSGSTEATRSAWNRGLRRAGTAAGAAGAGEVGADI